jgi:hypothetical protein
MTNLKVFYLRSCPSSPSVTQLLDFFESAPLLHTVELDGSIPDSSDAPPERTVPLPHLNTLTISGDQTTSAPSILLNHLHIPTGASLTLSLSLRGKIPTSRLPPRKIP